MLQYSLVATVLHFAAALPVKEFVREIGHGVGPDLELRLGDSVSSTSRSPDKGSQHISSSSHGEHQVQKLSRDGDLLRLSLPSSSSITPPGTIQQSRVSSSGNVQIHSLSSHTRLDVPPSRSSNSKTDPKKSESHSQLPSVDPKSSSTDNQHPASDLIIDSPLKHHPKLKEGKRVYRAQQEKKRKLRIWQKDPATSHLPPPDELLSIKERRDKRLALLEKEDPMSLEGTYARQRAMQLAGQKRKQRDVFERDHPGERVPLHLLTIREQINARSAFLPSNNEIRRKAHNKGWNRHKERKKWDAEHQGTNGMTSPPIALMTADELWRLNIRAGTRRYTQALEEERRHIEETYSKTNARLYPELLSLPKDPEEPEWMRHRRKQIWPLGPPTRKYKRLTHQKSAVASDASDGGPES